MNLPAMQVICKANGRTLSSYISLRVFAVSCIVMATIPSNVEHDEYIFLTASELKSGLEPVLRKTCRDVKDGVRTSNFHIDVLVASEFKLSTSIEAKSKMFYAFKSGQVPNYQ